MIFSPVAILANRKYAEFIAFSGFTTDSATISGTSNTHIGKIAIGVHSEAATSRLINSVTVNGVSATEAIFTLSGDLNCGIFYITTTGSTNNIVVTFSGTVTRGGISIWNLIGIDSIVPVSTQETSAVGVTELSIVNTGYSQNDIGIAIQSNSNQDTFITWTNANERYDTTVESLALFNGADYVTPSNSNYTISTSFSSSKAALCTAIWK